MTPESLAAGERDSERFRAEADAICDPIERRLARAARALPVGSGGRAPRPAAVRFGERKLLPALREQVVRVRQLGVPPDDEPAVGAILALVEDAIAELERDPGSIAERQPRAAAEAAVRAEGYGFEVCFR